MPETEKRTMEQTLRGLCCPNTPVLATPPYRAVQTYGGPQRKIFCAVEAMKRHTADAGWQLTLGLQYAGYELWGRDLGHNVTDVEAIIDERDPHILIMQDKREWEGRTAGQDRQAPHMRFEHVYALRYREDIFKLTVLKDAHQQPDYHRQSADEIGCHAWITYYHPIIVKFVAPYVREPHLVRTTHSVDADAVPKYQYRNKFGDSTRGGALLSGAINPRVYPLRSLVLKKLQTLNDVMFLPHPGYHAKGCVTPSYLNTLSRFKVAICTSSIYGYSLRKIYEATACGCMVITDLPVEDVLPEIDGNLIRISPHTDGLRNHINRILKWCYENYDPKRQQEYAERCVAYYNWKAVGERLADNIEKLRQSYND